MQCPPEGLFTPFYVLILLGTDADAWAPLTTCLPGFLDTLPAC